MSKNELLVNAKTLSVSGINNVTESRIQIYTKFKTL